VIPHGLSLARYSPVSASARRALRRRLGWRQDAFVFLSVGRNYARKGHEYSLEALRLLRAKSPALARRVYLYILTEVDEALAEFVHASGLTDNVWITDGYDAVKRPLSPRKLAELYQAADAFLLMSLSEGFGMPLLEAQAFGLPIVASNNSAIPEVVGDAGLLVRAPLRAAALDGHCLVWARPPDARHAAELMERVVRDAALRRRLAAAGRAHAAEYPWDMVGAKMVGLVEAALRDRASAKESSS
jgi:glycosyltransferase involved in cell wall biosynthesis